MIKILEKIRYSLFGERSITEKGDMICKNKKMTDTQKFTQLLDEYSNYLNSSKFNQDVTMEVYELYYEKFMINNVKHQLRYDNIKKEVVKEHNYLICTQIVRHFSTLKKIDKTSLNYKQIKLYDYLQMFAKKLYTPNFDYEKFYMDREHRDKINSVNIRLIDAITDYNSEKNKQQEEKDFFD